MHLRDELHPRVKRAQWIAERVIWAVIATIITLSVLGIPGAGLLSKKVETVTRDGVEIKIIYERWTRRNAPQSLWINVSAPAATGKMLSVVLPAEFASSINIGSILPEPNSTAVGPDGAIYTWQVRDWAEPVLVAFNFSPDRWRLIQGSVTVKAGDAPEQQLPLKQILFP